MQPTRRTTRSASRQNSENPSATGSRPTVPAIAEDVSAPQHDTAGPSRRPRASRAKTGGEASSARRTAPPPPAAVLPPDDEEMFSDPDEPRQETLRELRQKLHEGGINERRPAPVALPPQPAPRPRKLLDVRLWPILTLLVCSSVFYAFFFPAARSQGLQVEPAELVKAYSSNVQGAFRDAVSFPSRFMEALSGRSIGIPSAVSNLGERLSIFLTQGSQVIATGLSLTAQGVFRTVSFVFVGIPRRVAVATVVAARYVALPFQYAGAAVFSAGRSLSSRIATLASSTYNAIKFRPPTAPAPAPATPEVPAAPEPLPLDVLDTHVRRIVREEMSRAAATVGPDAPTLRAETVEQLMDTIVDRVAADKHDRPDFALASAGARVVATDPSRAKQLGSYLYDRSLGVVGLLPFRVAFPRAPETVLTPGVTPGECWAFAGPRGNVTIKLARAVIADQFTMEHTPEVGAFSVSSAPRRFRVFGLDDQEREELLGMYEFRTGAGTRHIQRFTVAGSPRVLDTVKLSILSNHGNSQYTCLYRFRVHGTSASS